MNSEKPTDEEIILRVDSGELFTMRRFPSHGEKNYYEIQFEETKESYRIDESTFNRIMDMEIE